MSRRSAGWETHAVTECSLQSRYMAGSQMWCKQKKMRRAGCGVIAVCDYMIYRHFLKTPKTREDYLRMTKQLQKHDMFVMPGLGISPFFYSLLVNKLFLLKGHPVWLHAKSIPPVVNGRQRAVRRLLDVISGQILSDIPVIFAVGPAIPIFGRKRGVTLYRRQGDGAVPAHTCVRAHYMTMTGICRLTGDEIYISVCSWGEQYLMKPEDYMRYSVYAIPFSNRIYLSRCRKTNNMSKRVAR